MMVKYLGSADLLFSFSLAAAGWKEILPKLLSAAFKTVQFLQQLLVWGELYKVQFSLVQEVHIWG